MKQEMTNLLIFMALCFIGYLIFRNISFKEGLTTESTTTSKTGVAGDAASYAASIKAASIKQKDTLLVSKYRSDYENVILNLDELIDGIMLNTALNIDVSSPITDLDKLSKLNGAKIALNGVMKYIDSSS
jgi:hypothetical protein